VAAHDPDAMEERDIKYVLSVFDDEVHHKPETIEFLKIDVDDAYDEDLLTHLPTAVQFIRRAQESGHAVLVHCHMGYSRSATVVIAYLMHKHQWSYAETRKFVSGKRSIGPNKGFVGQLQLWEEMGCKLDLVNGHFRQFVAKTILRSDTFFYPWNNRMAYYLTHMETLEQKAAAPVDKGARYLCAGCDRELFNAINVFADPGADAQSTCDYLYIEPQKWMEGLPDVREGGPPVAVKCPNCSQELVEHIDKFDSYVCDCPLHKAITGCLRFRIAANKVQIESKPDSQ